MVLDDQEDGQSEISLFAGKVVRMGMIPIRTGSIIHGELITVYLAGPDGVVRVPVVVGVHLEPVPVDDARLIARISKPHAQVGALAEA